MAKSATRNYIAAQLAEQLKINRETAEHVVSSTLQVIENALAQGMSVELRRFGVFRVVQRRQRVGRNPKNPKPTHYVIPAHKTVRFKLSSFVHKRLNP